MNMSIYLQIGRKRKVLSANYITMINPTLHPDRILEEHDFLYMLDGTWEIGEELPCPETEPGDLELSPQNIWHMESDDLLILPAGRHHFGSSLCSANNRHMYIHVNRFSGEPGGTEAAGEACGWSRFDSLIHCQGNPRIRELFEEIIAIRWESSRCQEEKLSLLMNLLLYELLEQQEQKEVLPASRNLAAEAARLIQTTPHTFFTGKELAEQFFVCERTLSNQFKKIYGKTVYAYQMEVKLEMVRQFLLSQPEVKLHETALNFGFYDEFHLSKAFRKRYGVPPSVYRSLHVLR